MRVNSPSRQAGLTLLELAVTLLILAMLTAVAVRSTADLQNEARYRQTEERLDMIREAILGDPRKTANGQTVISGFVADMGRLPGSLHELLEQAFCSDRTYSTQAACTAAGKTWGAQPAWQQDSASGLWFGWRGPYLRTTQKPNDADAFTDGWGREAQSTAEHSYGWRWALIDPYTNTADLNWLVLQSYGADMQAGGAGAYDADYPPNSLPVGAPINPRPLAAAEDWLIDIAAGIGISLNTRHGPDGYCGFSAGGTSEQSCKNAGGTWSGSCTFDANSCKSVGGKWQSCFFAPAACGAAGGAARATCQFSEKSCTAAGGAGSWDTTNKVCLVDSEQTKCVNAGGSWNASVSRCEFNERSCSLAGGAWVNDCAFASATCATAGGTWDSTNKPDSCAFTQAVCTGLNGVSNNSNCYMSHAEYTGAKYDPVSCEAAGGAWTARVCLNVFYRNPYSSAITYASSGPVSFDATGGPRTLRFSGFVDAGDADGDGIVTESLSSVFPFGIPAGSNAVGLYEFDGDCGLDNPPYPVGHDAPLPVDFHPRTTPPVIAW